ncbi:MAG: ATP-binding protein [Bauldia sp.]
MPKGLYQRSLIIIIAPMVLLQAVVGFVFMERHYQSVTSLLSAATTRDIAAVLDMIAADPPGAHADTIRLAMERLNLNVVVLPGETLPPPSSQPFFSLLDATLARQITEQIGLPFWIDTIGRSNLVEIRIATGEGVVRFFAQRGQTYASNSEIFIFWMIGTSLVLIAIAILFLRNQIVPIQRLADAAEDFGKGRPPRDFRPRGAREVRRASAAFMEMRERIVRQIEQRTTMLAGVSHDLRTVLTRFRLQLEFLADDPDAKEMREDVEDMQRMLEGYLAFAKGDAGEKPTPTHIRPLLERVVEQVGGDRPIDLDLKGNPVLTLRPLGFRRSIGNLVKNALRHGKTVRIAARHENGWLTIDIDDDGPGIPPDQREEVFRPFYRLDSGRNLDESGTGLGLAIARDIARGHGGEITLGDSPIGGVRATVRVPG